ncbi:hypothetical protein U1Q18_011217 [Sarracenia purpurea var. burkii]
MARAKDKLWSPAPLPVVNRDIWRSTATVEGGHGRMLQQRDLDRSEKKKVAAPPSLDQVHLDKVNNSISDLIPVKIRAVNGDSTLNPISAFMGDQSEDTQGEKNHAHQMFEEKPVSNLVLNEDCAISDDERDEPVSNLFQSQAITSLIKLGEAI